MYTQSAWCRTGHGTAQYMQWVGKKKKRRLGSEMRRVGDAHWQMKNEDAGRTLTGRRAAARREQPPCRRARWRQAAGQEAGGDGWAAARRPRYGRQRMQPSSIYAAR